MAPSARRGGDRAAARVVSLRRSARLAAAAAPAPPRALPLRRRRPYLHFRRSDNQACLAGHVARNQVVFVHAWPGTGRSSQVPRVLHAAGHGRVVCSQTYRLAAESAAAHAAADMRPGEVACCLQDPLDDPAAGTAAVTYTTHRALLRVLAADRLLARYGAVVVDEADDGMLLTAAVLSCVKAAAAARRPDLRVVILTHGTMFHGVGEALHGLFPGAKHLWFRTGTGLCPWEFLAAPVTDHVAAAVDTVCRIHATEPQAPPAAGGVLVFLPSRADVEASERLLAARALQGVTTRCLHDGVSVAHLVGGVLSPPTDGERKVVLATDVADSAVFVEGINYIVDSGYRCTDDAPPSLTRPWRRPSSPAPPPRILSWALKASVRSGYHIKRWGSRGKCFCLYTGDERRGMLRTGCSPLQTRTDDVDCLAGIVLVLLKDLGIIPSGSAAESFGFVLPPRPEKLRTALAALVEAGAVGLDGEVTEAGKRMAREILGRCYF